MKEEARAAQEKELPAVIEVKIDNHTEPFATIVTVEYGDKLGELLDTVAALKALGLNIKRAKLGADDKHKFYITDAGAGGEFISISCRILHLESSGFFRSLFSPSPPIIFISYPQRRARRLLSLRGWRRSG